MYSRQLPTPHSPERYSRTNDVSVLLTNICCSASTTRPHVATRCQLAVSLAQCGARGLRRVSLRQRASMHAHQANRTDVTNSENPLRTMKTALRRPLSVLQLRICSSSGSCTLRISPQEVVSQLVVAGCRLKYQRCFATTTLTTRKAQTRPVPRAAPARPWPLLQKLLLIHPLRILPQTHLQTLPNEPRWAAAQSVATTRTP